MDIEKLKKKVAFNKADEDVFIKAEKDKVKSTREVVGFIDAALTEALELQKEGFTILPNHPFTQVAPLNGSVRIVLEMPASLLKPLYAAAEKIAKQKYKQDLEAKKVQLAQAMADLEEEEEMQRQAQQLAQRKADRTADILKLIK